MSKAKGKQVVQEELPPEPIHGNGHFIMPDRSSYVGDFIDLGGVKTRNGNGILTTATNETYSGQWVNDVMTGTGEYTFANGSSYRGTFKNNMFDGEGTYSFPDGSHYTGMWQNNKMHGHGTFTDASGNQTTGEFINGVYASAEKSYE